MSELRKISEEELEDILRKHGLWLRNRYDGLRAVISDVDLSGVNLSDQCLNGIVFFRTNLKNASFYESSLVGATFYLCNLTDAIFDLSNLSFARFTSSELLNTKFDRAYLNDAFLLDSDLSEAHIICPLACPESGSFIGYKKAYGIRNMDEVIVELIIPSDAKRSSATGRKCRCDKAEVLSITDLDGNPYSGVAPSFYDRNFVYKVGETVSVSNFDENRWEECSAGIHFFITRQEAVDYAG